MPVCLLLLFLSSVLPFFAHKFRSFLLLSCFAFTLLYCSSTTFPARDEKKREREKERKRGILGSVWEEKETRGFLCWFRYCEKRASDPEHKLHPFRLFFLSQENMETPDKTKTTKPRVTLNQTLVSCQAILFIILLDQKLLEPFYIKHPMIMQYNYMFAFMTKTRCKDHLREKEDEWQREETEEEKRQVYDSTEIIIIIIIERQNKERKRQKVIINDYEVCCLFSVRYKLLIIFFVWTQKTVLCTRVR